MRPRWLWAVVVLLIITGGGWQFRERSSTPGATVQFTVPEQSRVSLAVYTPDGKAQLRVLLQGEWLPAGRHQIRWDGLDREGRPQAPGRYRWKLIYHRGLEADYLTALGLNPKAGGWARWPGNHTGPSCIAVGPSAVAIGATIAEGPPRIMVFEPDLTTERWYEPHYGWTWQGAAALGLTSNAVVMLQQDARVVVYDLQTGRILRTLDVLWPGDERAGPNTPGTMDLDADDHGFVIAYEAHDTLRWYEVETGQVRREVRVPRPTRLKVDGAGGAYVLSEGAVRHVAADGTVRLIVPASALVHPVALAVDRTDRSILVANGPPDERIVRFAADGTERTRYGVAGGRQPGPFHSDRFAEVVDLAADGLGGFFVVEGANPFRSGGRQDGGLRRVLRLDAGGRIVDQWFGPCSFFNVAAAVPLNPGEVYHTINDNTMVRYDLDVQSGDWRITHTLHLAPQTAGLFPSLSAFPFYRPLLHRGRLYFQSGGRYLLRPDLESGQLIPFALAAFRPAHGWPTNGPPPAIVAAVQHHGLDVNAPATDAFTWSDADGDGRLDPEEFRFASTGPGAGYAGLDESLNLYWGHYHAPNHTWTGRHWILWDFEGALYAKLPNRTPGGDAPTWDWADVQRSAVKLPRDPLGRHNTFGPLEALPTDGGRRVTVFIGGSAGLLTDAHPAPWPAVGYSSARLIAAEGDRLVFNQGKHRSEGPPLDAQFNAPSKLLGTVDDHLVVCDRMYWTTAYTRDGLFIGKLLDRHVHDELPAVYYTPHGYDAIQPILAGDDWMAAGSITDLGNGEALWCAPGGSRAMVFTVRGWRAIRRKEGTLTLTRTPPAAAFDGTGLSAAYYASTNFSGPPVWEGTQPRLWFANGLSGGQIVRDWATAPAPGLASNAPFSARWTGSVTAPLNEPFWFRVYNHSGDNVFGKHAPSWKDGNGFARVWLNGDLIIDKWPESHRANAAHAGPIRLQAGTTYDLVVEYMHPSGSGAQFSFAWCSYTYEWMRVPTQLLRTNRAPLLPSLGAAVQPPTPHPDLVAHYTFEGVQLPFDREVLPSDPVVPDQSGHGHHGELGWYMVPWVRNTNGPPGVGRALFFPTGRERVTGTVGDEALEEFTVAFWFKTTQPTARLFLGGGGELFLKEGNVGAMNWGHPIIAEAGNAVTVGRWHRLAYTWRQSERRQCLYLDGRLVGCATGPPQGRLTGVCQIGQGFTGGAIADVRIYRRCLSAAEIARGL